MGSTGLDGSDAPFTRAMDSPKAAYGWPCWTSLKDWGLNCRKWFHNLGSCDCFWGPETWKVFFCFLPETTNVPEELRAKNHVQTSRADKSGQR